MVLQGQCYQAPVCVFKATSPWLGVLPKDAMGAQKTMSGLQDFLWGEGWILPDEITGASFSSVGSLVATADSGLPKIPLWQPEGMVTIPKLPRGSRVQA